MRKSGQATIEFLFLVLITIVYITTVTVPTASMAQNTMYDTEHISRANNETQKIMNAVNEVAMLGTGSRQTIDAFIPDDTNIFCTDRNISFATTMLQLPPPADCTNGVCTKTFPGPSGIDINCTPKSIIGAVKTKIIVEKGTKISIALGS